LVKSSKWNKKQKKTPPRSYVPGRVAGGTNRKGKGPYISRGGKQLGRIKKKKLPV